MSLDTLLKNHGKAVKTMALQDFFKRKTEARADRLFADYGVDLPEVVIDYLRDKAKKRAEDYEERYPPPGCEDFPKGLPQGFSNESVKLCHDFIENAGAPAEATYEKFAESLGIGKRAFRDRYKKIYPTETL